MESAFGIVHTEISKGVPKGLITAAAGKRTGYAAERMKAHTEGKFAASIARPSKQYQNQGLPQHHLLDSTRSSGGRARAQSRLSQPQGKGSIGQIGAKKGRFVPRHFGPIGNPPERR
jgi:hypothetical protein